MAKKISAGLLAYRMRSGKREILLVHPGGPFWQNRDLGCWSIPKGEAHESEDLLVAAEREFEEETSFRPSGPYSPLGTAEMPNKTLHFWAFMGDFDPAKLVSNTCEIEWPPKSGQKMTIPECDRGEYFSIEVAKTKVYAYQVSILEAFDSAGL